MGFERRGAAPRTTCTNLGGACSRSPFSRGGRPPPPVHSSAPLFPALARRFVERNRERALREVERVFKFYADRGEIDFPQPQLEIEQFFISVVGIPQRLALLGLRESPEEQERRLRLAVRLFVRGCATGKPQG